MNYCSRFVTFQKYSYCINCLQTSYVLETCSKNKLSNVKQQQNGFPHIFYVISLIEASMLRMTCQTKYESMYLTTAI